MSNANALIAAPDVLFQPIQAWADHLSTQLGLVNVNVQATAQPQTEQRIVQDVASYGKQLGRIADVLLVLLLRLETRRNGAAAAKRTPAEKEAVARLLVMLDEIQQVKEQANLPRGTTRALLDEVLDKQ